MPLGLGGPEILIVLVLVLIVFGAGRLPNAFRDLGRGVKEFKKAQAEEEGTPTIPTVASAAPGSTAAPPAGAAVADGSTAATPRAVETAPRS